MDKSFDFTLELNLLLGKFYKEQLSQRIKRGVKAARERKQKNDDK